METFPSLCNCDKESLKWMIRHLFKYPETYKMYGKETCKVIVKDLAVSYCKLLGITPHTNERYAEVNSVYGLRCLVLRNPDNCVDASTKLVNNFVAYHGNVYVWGLMQLGSTQGILDDIRDFRDAYVLGHLDP